jgi:RNA-directed DNA polymerase
MKRIGGLWEKIISLENLREADRRARKGKGCQPGVKAHDTNREENLQELHYMLRGQTYHTSAYTIFTIHEPKERQIHRLPYYPDRIVHHAVMNVLEEVFMSQFTANTYSCVKGRGIHGAANAVKRALRHEAGTQYCLKLDIRKFYPSIEHSILKNLLRRKLKDEKLLWLLDEIIDSAGGLPIGNYLSQYLANFYLTGFDRWLKEEKRIRYYFRYADDLVILSSDKTFLHRLLAEIREYLWPKLKLRIKGNYQIFPVTARGIDFVGYVFFHTHILLRKGIKQRMARALAKKPSIPTLASYYGWVKHCNGHNLLKKLIHEKFQGDGDKSILSKFYRRKGKRRSLNQLRDQNIGLQDRAIESKAGHGLPHDANRMGRANESAFFGRQGVDGGNKAGERAGFPFQNHHPKN